MRFRVLGCGGSIAAGVLTSAYLVDDDILIDAGTGVGTLPLADMARIDHVFLSHSHTDHVALLPMLVDSVLSHRSRPLRVYGIAPTLEALSEHFFNWRISPDFREIRAGDHAAMLFETIAPLAAVDIGARRVTAIPVNHSVPTVAYLVEGPRGSIAVASDMTVSESLWHALNRARDLRHLLIEVAFQNSRIDLCRVAGHLCPTLLESELRHLVQPTDIGIVHVKPSARAKVEAELAALDVSPHRVRFVADGEVLTL